MDSDMLENSYRYFPTFIQDYEIYDLNHSIYSYNYFIYDYFLIDQSHFYNYINKLNNWSNENRFIQKDIDKNIECPISYEIINHSDKYVQCSTCNYNISLDSFKQILEKKYECPMCRSTWTNEIIYINLEDNINELKNK